MEDTIGVLFSVPMSLPAGPTTMTSQTSGAPDLSVLVELLAAFSIRDARQGRKTTPDLASDLWVLFPDCFDPAFIQLTLPFSPLEDGNISVKPHTPK